jgi:hypothetical protein
MDGNNWGDDVEAPPFAAEHDAWDDERRFHSGDADHRLRDAVREAALKGTPRPDRLPMTRRNPSGDYRMDRLYVSAEITVTKAGTLYGDGTNSADTVTVAPPATTRLTPGSDHALVWADVALR